MSDRQNSLRSCLFLLDPGLDVLEELERVVRLIASLHLRLLLVVRLSVVDVILLESGELVVGREVLDELWNRLSTLMGFMIISLPMKPC